MKRIVSILPKVAGILFAAITVAGCCVGSDKDYDNVTPPPVVYAKTTISGIITAKNGDPIQGATVTIGGVSVTTSENGFYAIEDVNPGTYDVTVTAEGKFPHEGTVEVPSATNETINVLYNAVLRSSTNRIGVKYTGEGDESEVSTEHIRQNNKAELEITAEIPEDAIQGELDEDEEIYFYLTPIYDESEAVSATSGTKAATKATVYATDDQRLLVGVTFSCSKPNVVLKKPVRVHVDVDVIFTEHACVKQFIDDIWQDIASSAENGKIYFNVKEFGSYGVFLPFEISEEDSSTALDFVPKIIDNLYGNGPVTVTDASYSYSVGTYIDVPAQSKDVMSALLLEKLAYYYGSASYTMSGIHPINLILPIGTRLEVEGYQDSMVPTVFYGSWAVNGTVWGKVRVSIKVTNRQHNGGSGGRY